MGRNIHTIITAFIFSFALSGSIVWFMTPPVVTKGATEYALPLTASPVVESITRGKRVIVYLQKMELELRDGDTIIATLPLLSQGKPGSYYETIGGSYKNDYKIPLHFSSIGHVYMPYSIHLFGNYFIHGVPYYPNGDPVSSAYSGGCIRLADEDAKRVYDFIERGTPIIITRDDETTFDPTQEASSTLLSIEMTNLMTASISLEFLKQDIEVLDTDGETPTTRKTILPRLVVNNDSDVAHLYASSLGRATFLDAMNDKAKALGLTNTHFAAIDSPASTTEEDYMRFMAHISTYKSYLRTLQNTGNR